MVTQYVVTWVVDIEATNPREAALKAQQMQRDPESIATVFDIENKKSGAKTTVDLLLDDME